MRCDCLSFHNSQTIKSPHLPPSHLQSRAQTRCRAVAMRAAAPCIADCRPRAGLQRPGLCIRPQQPHMLGHLLRQRSSACSGALLHQRTCVLGATVSGLRSAHQRATRTRAAAVQGEVQRCSNRLMGAGVGARCIRGLLPHALRAHMHGMARWASSQSTKERVTAGMLEAAPSGPARRYFHHAWQCSVHVQGVTRTQLKVLKAKGSC